MGQGRNSLLTYWFEWGSHAAVIQLHRPARERDHRHCGLTGNKSKPEEQKGRTSEDKETTIETMRWLRKFKGGYKETREKHSTLQGKADAEDESSQLAKMMESLMTPQAMRINYGLQRHFSALRYITSTDLQCDFIIKNQSQLPGGSWCLVTVARQLPVQASQISGYSSPCPGVPAGTVLQVSTL